MYGLPGDTWLRLIVWMAHRSRDLLPLRHAHSRLGASPREALTRVELPAIFDAAPDLGAASLCPLAHGGRCRDPSRCSRFPTLDASPSSEMAASLRAGDDGGAVDAHERRRRRLRLGGSARDAAGAAWDDVAHREPDAVAGDVRVSALDDVQEQSKRGAAALANADLLVVLDISDIKRLGIAGRAGARAEGPELVIDHHVPADEPAGDIVLAEQRRARPASWSMTSRQVSASRSRPDRRALYTALLTDTGGFRFSNTSPRCHAIAGELLAAGVDPEEMYRRIYASVPVGPAAAAARCARTRSRWIEHRARVALGAGGRDGAVRRCGRRTSTASSSTRARSRARGSRFSSATSATAR